MINIRIALIYRGYMWGVLFYTVSPKIFKIILKIILYIASISAILLSYDSFVYRSFKSSYFIGWVLETAENTKA